MNQSKFALKENLCYSPDRYLIFGGTGFLGRHFCEYLAERGIGATIISRHPDLAFLSSLSVDFTALTLQEFEAEQKYYFSKALGIIYLASNSIPGSFQDEPWLELSESVAPTFRLFSNASKTNPLLKIIYISSGGTVYGQTEGRPLPENSELSPISSYGFGKVVMEDCVKFLGDSIGLNYSILRVSNPVGIWQLNPRQGIVNAVIEKLANGGELTLYDRGLQIRDFVDADDVSDAIFLALTDKFHQRSVWNVASGQGYRIIDVISLIENFVQKKIKIRHLPARQFDVSSIVLDNSKIFNDLKWRPRIDLPHSIKKVLLNRGLMVDS